MVWNVGHCVCGRFTDVRYLLAFGLESGVLLLYIWLSSANQYKDCWRRVCRLSQRLALLLRMLVLFGCWKWWCRLSKFLQFVLRNFCNVCFKLLKKWMGELSPSCGGLDTPRPTVHLYVRSQKYLGLGQGRSRSHFWPEIEGLSLEKISEGLQLKPVISVSSCSQT